MSNIVRAVNGIARQTRENTRNIENILTRTMLPEMASECLSKMANAEDIEEIHVNVSDEGLFSYAIN